MRSSDHRNRGDRAATRLDALPAYAGRWAGTDGRRGAASANIDARMFNAVRHLTAADQEVWITVTGRSMEPTLRHGDRVLLRASRSSLRSGRVVLSEFRGRVVLHRVIRAGAESVTMAGDSCRAADPPVPHSAVIAEAVAVQTSRGVVPLRPTLRFGVARLLPYLRTTVSQKLRRARWRLTAALSRTPTNISR